MFIKNILFALPVLVSVLSPQTLAAVLERGLTPHFSSWLKDNGYNTFGFERTDLVGGAYGGLSSDSEKVQNIPVIFFHGNSDVAVGTNSW